MNKFLGESTDHSQTCEWKADYWVFPVKYLVIGLFDREEGVIATKLEEQMITITVVGPARVEIVKMDTPDMTGSERFFFTSGRKDVAVTDLERGCDRDDLTDFMVEVDGPPISFEDYTLTAQTDPCVL